MELIIDEIIKHFKTQTSFLADDIAEGHNPEVFDKPMPESVVKDKEGLIRKYEGFIEYLEKLKGRG